MADGLFTKDAAVAFCEGKSSAELQTVIRELVNGLNSEQVAAKKKLSSVVALSNLALVPQLQPLVMDGLMALDESFEKNLIDKEEGRKLYGTNLGPMHDAVLVLLIRARKYHFSGSDVAEFCRGDRNLALLLLTNLLKVTSYEDELRVTACAALSQMATPTAFLPEGAGAADVSEHSIEETINGFDKMTELCMSNSLLRAVTQALHDRFLKKGSSGSQLVHCHQCLTHFFTFVQSLFYFSGKPATHFRQHLSVASTIVPYIVQPYVQLCIDTVLTSAVAQDPLLAAGMKNALSLAVLICYQSDHVATLRDSPLLLDLLSKLPPPLSSPPLVAAVLMLIINLDACAADSPSPSAPTAADIRQGVTEMIRKSTDREAIASILDSSNTRSPPLCRSNVTYAFIESLLVENAPQSPPLPHMEAKSVPRAEQVSLAPAASLPAAAAITIMTKEVKNSDNGKGKEEKRRDEDVYAPPPSSSSVSLTSLAGMPSLLVTKQALSRRQERNESKKSKGGAPAVEPPSRFLCALDGHVMKEPMKSPYGQVFDKTSIEKWLSHNNNVCPVTGKPLTMGDLEPHESLALAIHTWQIRTALDSNDE